MAGSYSQIYLQIVFAVKGRQNLLLKPWREEVFKYMAGIINEKKHKTLIINGVEDHVHVFVGFKPSTSISDLVRDIKNNSSKFINERNFLKQKFAWQEGYGVFSYSPSHVENVFNYIAKQEEHHKKKTFQQEYKAFLEEFAIEFEEKFLFDWVE